MRSKSSSKRRSSGKRGGSRSRTSRKRDDSGKFVAGLDKENQ